MKKAVLLVKEKLDACISQLSEVSWMFSKKPGVYFTRDRKLSFEMIISTLLSMEGGSLTSELLKRFGCSADIASASAFVQQRRKLSDEVFPMLFSLFVKKTDSCKRYKGLRILAADGSDIHIPTNPNSADSYFPGTDRQAAYNMLHLDAVYDLLQHTYIDALLAGQRKVNEQASLCKMVDRSSLEKVLLIADRGYEGYNLLAHVQEKGWKFLIRVKDIHTIGGFTSGLTLPDTGEFDLYIDLSLTTKASKDIKELCNDRNRYRYIPPTTTFDFLPKKNRKYQPAVFYKLPFRIVRVKITDDTYETVVTNLDARNFPADELKKLYNMRWGIETSFRELKYTVGLLHFHAKKVEHICQEVFARLIMYNFSELITSYVVIQKNKQKIPLQSQFFCCGTGLQKIPSW